MQNRRANKGFTLIELVIVLAILAALAGLVIPQISMLGRTTDMAASAATQSDLSNNLQLFFVLQKRYPQGLDSLMTSATTLYTAGGATADTQTAGLPVSGADGSNVETQLEVTTFTKLASGTVASTSNPDFYRSFTRSGFDYLYDHDTTVANANNSAITSRPLTTSTIGVATLKITPTIAPLIAKLLPQGFDTVNEKLVVLGIGKNNSAIGKTIQNAPIYPGADGKYYGRYLAVFRVSYTGERAILVGVIDAYGRTPDYTQQQYNESLPDGGRQG